MVRTQIHLPLIALLLAAACNGEMMGVNNLPPPTTDEAAPCTDYRECCPAEELRCEGDPDGVVVCTCDTLWDCSKNPNKCEADKHVPGGGSWNCKWTEFDYSCTQGGREDTPPSGGGNWTCTFNKETSTWHCKKPSPNPTNVPGHGSWDCDVVGDSLKCDKIKPDGNGDKGTPDPEPNPDPPGGNGDWKCDDKKENCEKDGGFPDGGGDWNCHLTEMGTWVCVGKNVPGKPDGGGSWDCVKTEMNGESVWICKKPNKPGEDTPPGGGHWACEKSSEFGTRCENTPDQPKAPGLEAEPGEKCVPGTKRWCDGLQYCGWGQMTCKPDGTWPTKMLPNGKVVYDCQELASGARPNTACACFHFYYNGDCCERPDCMVPEDTPAQICPKSKGELCDYCNPRSNECKGAGARCIATGEGEAFCGRSCSAGNPCPSDYDCVPLRSTFGILFQCMPKDRSCYY